MARNMYGEAELTVRIKKRLYFQGEETAEQMMDKAEQTVRDELQELVGTDGEMEVLVVYRGAGTCGDKPSSAPWHKIQDKV